MQSTRIGQNSFGIASDKAACAFLVSISKVTRATSIQSLKARRDPLLVECNHHRIYSLSPRPFIQDLQEDLALGHCSFSASFPHKPLGARAGSFDSWKRGAPFRSPDLQSHGL